MYLAQSSFRQFAGRAFGIAVAATLVTISAAPVEAQTVAGTIGVALTVTNACVVNGAQTVQSNVGSLGDITFADQPGIFGTVDGQLVGSLGTLQVLCTPGIAPQLTIGSGANDSAGKRRMTSSGNMLDYRLFSDAQRSAELAVGSRIALGTSTATPFSIPIYARVSGGSGAIAAGRYADTVQVTLSW